jgi:cyclophilin family peptidyl-prolyl cis-trans isomerase/HEAT repeat protein
MRYAVLGLFVFVCTFFACVPPEAGGLNSKSEINIDLKDQAQRRLIELGDERKLDSLVVYLRNTDPTLRYLALRTLGSMHDSTTIPIASDLLKDPVKSVRIAAAQMLGLSGSEKAQSFLLAAFDRTDSLSVQQDFNEAVLEAVGRCGSASSLAHLASIKTFRPTDTLLLTGQCKGIYRFAARGITSPEATQTMTAYVGNVRIPYPARLMAAHYLARGKEISYDSSQVKSVIDGFWSTTEPDLKMALAKAAGKSKAPAMFSFLAKAITTETDYRVKCNLINAFAGHAPDTVLATLSPMFYDTNLHVARTAAEFFIKNGNASQADQYWRYDQNESRPWPVRVALFQASNRWLSSGYVNTIDHVNGRLRDWFTRPASSGSEKAACLMALAENGWQFRWIKEKGYSHNMPVVKSAATEALKYICQRDNFYSFFGGGSTVVRYEMNIYLMEALANGDAGMMSGAAEALATKALQFPAIADSTHTAIIYGTLAKLKLPRDIETYRAVQKTVDYYSGKPESPNYKPSFSNPINWAIFSGLSEGSRVKIQTTQGEIELELFPQEAPGSVASFIRLANEGFYDKKSFHRVVPNFVIQGGCPRGDGFGSLDYCLRTEISKLKYDDAGWVGMASAGVDTEGTQFFITHSPTPHLDGNYTIFARVTSGMDVVHKIQVGDVIQSIVVKG